MQTTTINNKELSVPKRVCLCKVVTLCSEHPDPRLHHQGLLLTKYKISGVPCSKSLMCLVLQRILSDEETGVRVPFRMLPH